MKVCKKCKTENPSSATYCMKCGDLLVEEEQLTEEDRLRKLLRESEAEKELLRAALKAKSNETKKEQKPRVSLHDKPNEGNWKRLTDMELMTYRKKGYSSSPDKKTMFLHRRRCLRSLSRRTKNPTLILFWQKVAYGLYSLLLF